jgi:hypothetical protein
LLSRNQLEQHPVGEPLPNILRRPPPMQLQIDGLLQEFPALKTSPNRPGNPPVS